MPQSAAAAAPYRDMIPKALLRAMLALVLVCLAIVTWARLTDRPLAAKPADGPIAHERSIQVFADTSGAARVLDADGTLIVDLPANKGGFIAGVWRSLEFVRGKAGLDPEAPARLIQFKDGRLALKDDLSGWRVELIGFGADNAASFARLLDE